MSHHPEPADVRTVGVDLAKAHTTTAVCTIHWTTEGAFVDVPVVPARDDVVLAAAQAPGVAAVAIDAPFGWPRTMVAAVSSWRPGGRWTHPEDHEFRLRQTDRFTAEHTHAAVKAPRVPEVSGLQAAVPLSVSADKIAMAAWRCCTLLDALAKDGAEVVTDALGRAFPADGRRRVVEAYPAAALAMWGVPRQGYKKTDEAAEGLRLSMLNAIEGGGGDWLRWSPGTKEQYAATDHALDAFVCALVARAAMLGLVEPVPRDQVEASRAEGWIALPRADGLREEAVAPRSPRHFPDATEEAAIRAVAVTSICCAVSWNIFPVRHQYARRPRQGQRTKDFLSRDGSARLLRRPGLASLGLGSRRIARRAELTRRARPRSSLNPALRVILR